MDNPYYTLPEEPGISEPPASAVADPAAVRHHFSRVGLAYLTMTVAFMAAAYAAQFALLNLRPELLNTWWMRWVLSLLPLYGVGLPILWLMLRKIPASPHNTDCTVGGLRTDKPAFGFKPWAILLVIAFGCMTAGSILGNIIMTIMSAVMQYDYAFALNSMVYETPVWFTLICTCICAPLGEELIFRKLLIDRTRRYGDWTAILLSGLLFGLFHGNLFQFFYAALVGMILAYVYTRSGSYRWCVAMHAAINFMGSIVIPALGKLITPYLSAEVLTTEMLLDPAFLLAMLASLLLSAWQYGMLIAGIVLFCVCFKRRKLSNGMPLPEGNRASVLSLANPGMIACLVIMLLLLAVNLIPVR